MSSLRARFYLKIFFFTALFFALCGFQTSFWPNLITLLPSPQFWLMMIFFISLRWTPLFSVFYIYFLGFCLTRFSQIPLKMAWTTLLTTFCLLSLFKDRVRLSGALSFSFFTLLGSIIFEVSYVILSHSIEVNPTSFQFFDRLIQIIMNFIFSYPAYRVFEWLDHVFYDRQIWSATPEQNEDL
ncbi:MAG: hypothetical protein A2622_00930 [Bdellovibrionales bacterium RIFCSPHIGHO2_01_FULL_40_29]|nr:MAG: hypothetical protein A2622_00930 [Bdellovibrionales bacterium RIFCSPHIGHO2_01_FULL_40_29]OFZ32678.1 MAG: hypothetical protein A3D17_05530 [Bdellovibrionales bacterium RIFCSPHIGHO2_02_FULL_40_15]